MTNLLKKWYAAVYMAVTENHEEPEETRYSTHMHVLAVDQSARKIEQFIRKLCNQYGLPTGIRVEDVTNYPGDYTWSKIIAIDEYDLDSYAVADYSKRHRILSYSDFKLTIPKNFP